MSVTHSNSLSFQDKQRMQEEQERLRLASLTEEDKALEHAFKDTFQIELAEQKMTTAQMQETEQLLAESSARISTFKTTHTAEGSPIQQYQSPKRGFKKRREDKRLLKEYREKIKWKDADLFAMETDLALKERATEKSNADNVWKKDPELAERVTASRVDDRVLQIHCQGFKVNEAGEPLDETEAAKKAANITFIEDYISGDIEKRRPYLDKMTDKFLNAKLDPDMLTDDYVHDHILELKDLTNELCYFENILRDEKNAQYFEEMNPLKRRLIETRFEAVGNFNLAVTSVCYEHGVGFDSNGLMANPARYISQVRGQSQFAIDTFKKSFKSSQIKEESLIVDVKFRKLLKSQTSNPNGGTYNGSSGASDPAKLSTFKKAFQEMPLKTGETKPADLEKEKTGNENLEVEKNSAIALSNQAYKKALDEGKTGDDLTKAAIDALGLRRSNTAMQKADEAMHGTIFNGFKEKYKELYDAISDEAEIPVEAMSHTLTTKTIRETSASTRPFGAGVEALGRTLLSLFKNTVLTDTSGFNEYINEAYKNWGQAKVFQDKRKFAQYVVNNLWLKYTAQAKNESVLPRQVINDKGEIVQDDRQEAVAKMFQEATRSVLSMYRIELEMTKEDVERLPNDQAEYKQLYKEYEAMLDTVVSKIRSSSDAASNGTGDGAE